MKVWQFDAFGLENLALNDRDVPEPGPGQVRVAMRAASLNYRDLLMVRGHYNPRQPLPLVPCSDGVGVVDAIGDDVDDLAVGQRVCGIFSQQWMDGPPTKTAHRSTLGGPIDGTLAEYMVLDASGLVTVPEHLTDAEAATLPCAAVTAWHALVDSGGVESGDTVLVLGTGGVSIFALQLARHFGATVIATSSSDEKLDRARALGAAHGINYRETPEWARAVREITDGRGVDHVVEVGGAGTFGQSIRAVRMGGHVALIGVLAGGREKIDLTPVLMNGIRVQGIFVGSRASFEAMNGVIEQSGLRPVVDRVFPFEEAPAAFEHMRSGSHFGKVVVSIGR